MYESFYGLNEQPFSLTPDPQFFFVTQNFKEAINKLIYAVNRREAISVVTGDVGTGKTLLCRLLLLRMARNVRTALILNPILEVEDLLRAIIQDFGIKQRNRPAPQPATVEGKENKLSDAFWLEGFTRKQLIDELNRFLLEGVSTDLSSILVIDEAQNLSLEALELLRLLSNLETSKRKLLQIIFVGQLEFDQKLNLPQLRQLKQRVVVRCSLRPLSKPDMIQYIYHRLWKAGGKQSVSFSKGALNKIYKHSGGYPRLINIICDRALLAGYNKRSRNITARIVRTALLDLGRAGEIITPTPFLFSLKGIVTATIILVILAAIAYLIGQYGFTTAPMDQNHPVMSDHGGFDMTTSKIPEQLPPSEESLPQTSVISTDASDDDVTAENRSSTAPVEGTVSDDSNFLLQVHSLKTQQQADSAITGLRGKGYPAFQRVILNPGNVRWYVVYIGPFDDVGIAQATAETLLKQEGLPTILKPDTSREN